jgi:hypothetical protein
MRIKRLKISAVILLGLGLTGLQAQESMNTTGGDASGSAGSLSYSVGQAVYQTHTSTSGSVAEGVQQPYEISVVLAKREAVGITLSVSAYPNPTTDNLTLSVEAFELSNVSYQLFDINGRILQNGKIASELTSIAMGNLVSATYFIKVVKDNKEIKTFKIIKQ